MPAPKAARFAAVEQPYPGLRPFDLKDAFLFFGREQHTQELLDRLSRNRFLAVVGTSGSGKSSLVRAGLMPALYRGYLVGDTSRWRIAVMRPGSAPMDELAAAVASKDALALGESELRPGLTASSLGLVSAVHSANLSAGESLLLVVDQFEELFRFASERRSSDDTGEAFLFVSSLLEAVDQFEVPIYVVLTMRTDFLGDCTLFPGLPEALNRSQYLIPRLTREQRRDAIERPIEIANAQIAPRLVQQILNDMGDDPDQLPIMQHALARMYGLWKQSGKDTPLDLDDYERAGAIARALNDHAEALYQPLDPAGQEWTRRIFRALTKMEKGREVRRPARLDRIFGVAGASGASSQAAVLRIVEAYASAENSLLVVTPAQNPEHRIIDISHESLIRKWRLLSRWVKDEAESAEWFSDLLRDTKRQAAGETSYWTNPELGRVLALKARDGWTAAWANQYCATEKEGFAATERFLEGSRRKERNRKIYYCLGYAAALAVLILGLYSWEQRRHAHLSDEHAKAAERELKKLEAEDEAKAAQIEMLIAKRDSATGEDRKKLQNQIDSLQSNLVHTLQQENAKLRTELDEARQARPGGDQTKTIASLTGC